MSLKDKDRNLLAPEGIEHAAAQLLFGAILKRFRAERKGKDYAEHFDRLAALTRDHDVPALRVAHCLRDLAGGDLSRKLDLTRMVREKPPRATARTCASPPPPPPRAIAPTARIARESSR